MSEVESVSGPGGITVDFSREATATLDGEHYSAFARGAYIARVSHPRLSQPIIVVLPLGSARRDSKDWALTAMFYAGVASGRGDDTIVVVSP